jgi:hypothetical protein
MGKMSESIQAFNAIRYTTPQGENCVATKKDGIVTIQGDQNGVRQMPVNDFMHSFSNGQVTRDLDNTSKNEYSNYTKESGKSADNGATKSTIGVLALSALALGVYFLTRGRAGAKAAKPILNLIKPSRTKGVVNGVTHSAQRTASSNTRLLENAVKDTKPAVSNVSKNLPAIEGAAPKTPKVVPETKVANARTPKNKVSEFGETGKTSLYSETEVPLERRGAYGQDITDPLNPLNKSDYLSPYYESPVLGTSVLDDPYMRYNSNLYSDYELPWGGMEFWL